MSVGVQCLLCRRVFCRQRQAEVEYAYCESCYGGEVRRLESILEAYKERLSKQEVACCHYDLHCKRQLDFLSQLPGGSDSNCEGASQGNMLLWDVILLPADGLPVAAHKAVLAGRSPVFRAMFYSCPMREATENKVRMGEMPREALVAFVEFMYTAAVTPEVMQRHAEVLFCAAHKYRVGFLRVLCEKELARQVGPHNALPMLSLARCYAARRIWTAVLQAAMEARNDLPSAFSYYQQFAAHDPSLLLHLYHALLRPRHGHAPNSYAKRSSSSSSSSSLSPQSVSSRKRRRTVPTA